MTVSRPRSRTSGSNGWLARIARPGGRPATHRSPAGELDGMITLVPAVDFGALRDLIDGNPHR